MSCSRYQFGLSRCLDGRLPGGRRTEVMEHVNACPKCTQVWEEMQAAQSIVLGLKEHTVGVDFRDQVWDRIHSGEGATDILLQEPISAATKLRYGLIGAAAAAVFAFGLHLLTTNYEGSPVENPLEDELVQVDDTIAPDPVQPTPHEFVRGPDQNAVIAQPVTQLAVAAVDKVIGAARRLRDRREVILQPVRRKNVPLFVWTQVEDDIRTLSGGLFILERLQNKKFVRLETKTNTCVSQARTMLNMYERDASRRDLSLVVQSLSDCSLDGLSNLQIIHRIPELRQPHLVYDILAEPKIQIMVKRLGLSSSPGWFFMPFAVGSGNPQFQGSWSMRIQARPSQPAGKKLRKRSPK